MKSAVVLLSGGLDSAVTLALCKRDGFDAHALSFDYGQRHVIELRAAKAVAMAMHVGDHRVAAIDLRLFGGSALTDHIDVPQQPRRDDEIPVTYVPARNTIFLSYALAFAEVIGSTDIYLGVNAVDYSGYPDCRPEFLQAFQRLAALATKAAANGSAVTIHAPLLHLSKAEIIRCGLDAGVDFALTHSCYAPDQSGVACGRCESCRLRLNGFREAGVADPARYQS